jgi:hypothetical protein
MVFVPLSTTGQFFAVTVSGGALEAGHAPLYLLPQLLRDNRLPVRVHLVSGPKPLPLPDGFSGEQIFHSFQWLCKHNWFSYCIVSDVKYRSRILIDYYGVRYVSELRPLTDILFIPQMIYEFGERRWNDTDRGTPKNSVKNLFQCHKSHID